MRVVAFLLLCGLLAAAAVAGQQHTHHTARVQARVTRARERGGVTDASVAALACPACRVGDAVPAAAAAPAAPVATPAAPAAAAPAAAAPASVDVAALAAVQRGVEELRSAALSSASDLKAAQAATDSKVAALAATVEQGLQKLHAADAAQTAADEAQAKAAGAGASSADSHKATSAVLEKIQADTKARLESVEKELSEMKKMLANFVSSTLKPAADPALAEIKEIKAATAQIIAQLANATAAWSFDHEQIMSQIKTASYTASSRLTKFVQKTYASVLANYPSYAAQAREMLLQGADQAQVLGGQAQQLSADAHLQLTQLLLANGVPKEFVQYAALSVLGLVALLLTVLLWSILKCFCRCICCRSRKAPKGGKAAKASK